MQYSDFGEMMESTFDEIRRLNDTKGREYAGEGDALGFLKNHAQLTGLRPEQVWSVLAGKHWQAIMTYTMKGTVGSEPIEGRLQDLILYSLLMLGLVKEKQEEFTTAREGMGVPSAKG